MEKRRDGEEKTIDIRKKKMHEVEKTRRRKKGRLKRKQGDGKEKKGLRPREEGRTRKNRERGKGKRWEDNKHELEQHKVKKIRKTKDVNKRGRKTGKTA